MSPRFSLQLTRLLRLLHHVLAKRGPSLLTRLWPAFPPSSPLSFHKHQLPQGRKSPLGQGQQPQELQDVKVCGEETGGHADWAARMGRPSHNEELQARGKRRAHTPALSFQATELTFEPPSLSLTDSSRDFWDWI